MNWIEKLRIYPRVIHWRLTRNRRRLYPGTIGTLGVGAGFAPGAKLVHPVQDIWIVFGDGSVGYSLTEFDTFVRHGIPVIAVVGNDAGWTQIARGRSSCSATT